MRSDRWRRWLRLRRDTLDDLEEELRFPRDDPQADRVRGRRHPRDTLGLLPRRTVYVPQSQTPASMMGGLPRLMMRTTRPAAAMQAVTEALPEIDPRLREPTF